MNKIVVTLEEMDIVELQAILTDRDKDAALDFLDSRIAAQIPRKGTLGCDSTRRNPYLLKPSRK